jgi:NAD-dependent SIR2 family protein deacetylase
MSKALDNLHRKMVRIGIDPFTGGAIRKPHPLDDTLDCECECGHRWNEKLNLPAPMEEAGRQIKSIRCNHCGGKKIVIHFGEANGKG